MDSPEVQVRYKRNSNGTFATRNGPDRGRKVVKPNRRLSTDAAQVHREASAMGVEAGPSCENPDTINEKNQSKLVSQVDNTVQSCTIKEKAKPKEGKDHCYDKTDYCTFCGKGNGKIRRHIINVHSDVPEVYAIKFLEKQSEERCVRMEMLINEGNFKHNVQVLKEGKGHFVVARRASPDKHQHRPTEYVPCEFCRNFFLIDHLWKHIQSCKVRQFFSGDSLDNLPDQSDENEDVEKNFVRRGRQLLSSALIDSESVEETHRALFSRMHRDDITLVGENDDLIRKIGHLRMEGLGDEDCQKRNDVYRVSQAVRTLSRLVIQARKEKPAISLCSLLTPPHFDVVVRATKAMSIQGNNALTLAGKIGNLLGHAVVTKIGLGLRKEDNRMVDEATRFKQLFEAEWMYRINKVAAKRKSKTDMKKKPKIPLVEDLMNLRSFVMQRCVSLSNELQVSPSPACWTELCRTLLVRLVMFNKRRVAEVCELDMETYLERPAWTESDMEFEEAMTPLEKKFAQRYAKYGSNNIMSAIDTIENVSAIHNYVSLIVLATDTDERICDHTQLIHVIVLFQNGSGNNPG